MLEDTTFNNVVSWGPHGDCFVVKDMNEFTKTILPRMFKHSNFASFVRQLNKYDFHKVSFFLSLLRDSVQRAPRSMSLDDPSSLPSETQRSLAFHSPLRRVNQGYPPSSVGLVATLRVLSLKRILHNPSPTSIYAYLPSDGGAYTHPLFTIPTHPTFFYSQSILVRTR